MRTEETPRGEIVIVLFVETRSVVGFDASSVTEKRRRRERRRRIGGGGSLVVSIGFDLFSLVTENTKRGKRDEEEKTKMILVKTKEKKNIVCLKC